MTNVEARDALAVAFPRLTWRLTNALDWGAIACTFGETEIKVTPPDDYIHVTTWRCSIRSLRGASGFKCELAGGEDVVGLVRRTVREFMTWAESVREAVSP